MKKTILTLAVLFAALALFAGAPEVTAVTASQQENLVVIDYYLAHPDELLCDVSVEISDDGGLTYGILPGPGSLSGDIGIVEATEQGAPRQIVWDYSQDGIPSGTNYRAKVIADDNIPAIPSPLTQVLTAADLPFFAHLDEMNLVLLNTAPVAYYTPGNILVMAPCPQIPSGLMRKVVSAYPQGNLIFIETVSAKLEEAFDQLQLNFSEPLKVSDVVSSKALVDGITFVPGAKDFSFPFNLNVTIPLDDGVELTVSGDLTFTLGCDFSASVSFWNGLHKLKAGGHGEVDATIELEITGGFSVDKKIELYEQTFAMISFMAGPVPVWMTPSVAIVLELEAGGGASITTSVTANADFSAGVKYNKSNSPRWSTYSDYDLSFDYEPPSLSVGLNASVAAGPQLELNMYSVAGPFVFAAGYLALDADLLDIPWWTLMGGFKADAGVEFEVLSFELEWSATVFDYSIILAQASTDQVAQPSFSPGGGDYTGYQDVTISCSTAGASIRYTTDGNDPTTASTLYTGPVNINSGTTLKAKAFKGNWLPSNIATATYTISIPAVATPVISPAAGDHMTSVAVSISCASSNVDIRYTTDGSTPTTSSLLYSIPFTLTESATVKAKAFDTDTSHDPLYNPSLTASAAYVILSEEEYPTAMDASIHVTMPNANDGSGERLTVRNAVGNPLYPPPAGSWQIDALVWFDLSSVPSSSTVASATLKLYYYEYKDNDPAGRTLSLFRALQPWNEATVTWNNQPAYAAVASATGTVPASTFNWMDWDVTSDVQAFVNGTNANHGWKVTDLVPWNDYNIPISYFRSREYVSTNQRPVLEVQLAGKAEPLIFK
ncbi:MAG: chitobiase/beta-hexosaminidase C-terminal domain-containing protein [Candidatus Cloacimonetes bacterium]|nr:chitobiase/beta-hexosaminidase C-terminal domain-containing protein [Candidatus Cloacimonadota bacterium]